MLDVGCRVGRRQRNGQAAPRQRACNACSNGGLADAALAHRHDDARASLGQLCDQRVEALCVNRSRGEGGRRFSLAARVGTHRAQSVDSHEPEREQWHVDPFEATQGLRERVECCSSARLHRRGGRVARIASLEYAIENQPHVGNSELRKLGPCTLRFTERGALGPRDQHERRLRRVAERLVRGSVERLLRIEPGERP